MLTAAEPVRLTTDGTNKRDPRFIEGGASLIYCYDETTALIRMMRLKFPHGEPTPVFENAASPISEFLRNNRVQVLKPETGNAPNCFFIGIDREVL